MSNGDRMFAAQERQGWTDETLGELALTFVFDPDLGGKGKEFADYCEHVARVENGEEEGDG